MYSGSRFFLRHERQGIIVDSFSHVFFIVDFFISKQVPTDCAFKSGIYSTQ